MAIDPHAYHKPDDAELRRSLTQQQYDVTQGSGTERAFTGEYHDNKRPGPVSYTHLDVYKRQVQGPVEDVGLHRGLGGKHVGVLLQDLFALHGAFPLRMLVV